MNRSQFIAGLVGPVLAVAAVSLLINRQLLGEIETMTSGNPGAIFLIGIVTLVVGLATVMGHNVWRGWPMIITLLGWNALLAGLARILLPFQIAGAVPHIAAQSWVFVVVVGLFLALGLFLSFKAFRP